MGCQMNPDDFINWIYPVAQEICTQNNLPAAVVTAQGALESGWNAYTIGNYNLFPYYNYFIFSYLILKGCEHYKKNKINTRTVCNSR